MFELNFGIVISRNCVSYNTHDINYTRVAGLIIDLLIDVRNIFVIKLAMVFISDK